MTAKKKLAEVLQELNRYKKRIDTIDEQIVELEAELKKLDQARN